MANVNSYSGGMAAPDKTTLPEIVRVASELLERTGAAGLTMHAVAAGVGVRAPSLYKRVAGREALLQLVSDAQLRELGARLETARNLPDLANRFRAFAHERPEAFQLIMSPGRGAAAPDAGTVTAPDAGTATSADASAAADHAAPVAASAAVLRLVARTLPEVEVLDAARTLTAWATGFVTMELGGGFQLEGDIERAWNYGVDRMTALIGGRGQADSARTPASRP